MTKIGLISLGCAKNLVDSEHMLARLRDAGYAITDDITEAEVGIVNTCGFIEAAKTEAIETILDVARYKEQGKLRGLIVTGCLAQRYRAEIESDLPEVDAICGTGSYENIVDAVRDVLDGKKAVYMRDMAAAALEGERDRLTPSYTAFLKIAEGCSNRCGYCIIPKLRGPYRSRQMEDVLTEARELAASGVKEIIVIAQDITKYGLDLPEHKRLLPELLRQLCQMDFTWVRLHYLYPDQITDELVDVIAQEPKIVKYLDIPLQHVSKRILRAMHRPGDRDELTALIHMLRERIPGLVLRTSLIVGLPGETEEEFAELCAFLQETRIERAGVFEFSPEEGTEAAELPGQIDDDTKMRRRLIIEELQSGVIDDYNLSRMHETLDVLCEGWDNDSGLYFGRTYADSVEVDGKVYFASETPVKPGDFVPVRMENSLGADLEGVRVGGSAS
ncbi:30S ribosomal protein S12 methylthiotransferase RimO [Intestinibacillus sp. Marseille-P6563]|uniref:30S ribosomal protein S12 methylthiotransferase RimO n=1 Tax=Intestinibacillus sp. Marseille-P6563 TaxID=2364792 RepID=UPI000F0592EE|nr:30S ribosomal protein S12 methylthiotransferase RimO [Intestinibacillus sp. Marseille-P6563]